MAEFCVFFVILTEFLITFIRTLVSKDIYILIHKKGHYSVNSKKRTATIPTGKSNTTNTNDVY